MLLLLLALAPLQATAAAGERLSGPPLVITGEILEVAGVRLKLTGIDAPEPGQSCQVNGRDYDCGRISATALMDLTAGVEVSCTLAATEPSSVGLRRATCFADGYDLSEGMVYTGWALADPESGARYKPLEKGAKSGRRGLWRGSFETPWAWRARTGD